MASSSATPIAPSPSSPCGRLTRTSSTHSSRSWYAGSNASCVLCSSSLGAGDAQASDYAAAVQAVLPPGDDEPPKKKRLSAFLLGYSLNAATHLHANDREGIERLCRYGARPPLPPARRLVRWRLRRSIECEFALERLSQLPDCRLSYRLRRPRNGRTHLVLEPLEFLRKLATLIPPPRHHLTRFHGVLAPHASWRREVVPEPPAPAPCSAQFDEPASPTSAPTAPTSEKPAPSRIPWA